MGTRGNRRASFKKKNKNQSVVDKKSNGYAGNKKPVCGDKKSNGYAGNKKPVCGRQKEQWVRGEQKTSLRQTKRAMGTRVVG
jgi:hypothetical protein